MPQSRESLLEGQSESFEPKIERKGNVVTVTKPEGSYSFIYGTHLTAHPAEKLPKRIDGFLFEGGNRYDLNPYDMIPDLKKDYEEVKNFFSEFESQKIPLFFYDVSTKHPMINVVGVRTALLVLESYLGYKLLESSYQSISGKKLTRRDALKVALKGVSGLWAVSGPATRAGGAFLSGGAKRVLARLHEDLHPEMALLVLTFRNAVMAHKMQWLAERMPKPHFAGTLGGAHVLIEDQIIKSPEQRLEFLRKVTPWLKSFIDPKSFYLMRRFDYDGKNWQHSADLEIPELKAIVEQPQTESGQLS